MTNEHTRNEQAMQEILTKAEVDERFRAALIRDPRAVLDAHGCVLPPDYTVRFVEKDAAFDAMFVLPDFVDPDSELTPEDLDAVAGGELDVMLPCRFTCWG